MEPKVTQFGIVSKKKNYDSTSDPELIDQLKQLDENITNVRLSGNSYSTTFCEEFISDLKKLKRLEVQQLSFSMIF
jgi:Ran GTPase-activating protein (RanGAP) involved in mRNA processing and transport